MGIGFSVQGLEKICGGFGEKLVGLEKSGKMLGEKSTMICS